MATEDVKTTEIIDLNLEPENRMEQILNGETLEPEDRTEYFVQKALGRFSPDDSVSGQDADGKAKAYIIRVATTAPDQDIADNVITLVVPEG